MAERPKRPILVHPSDQRNFDYSVPRSTREERTNYYLYKSNPHTYLAYPGERDHLLSERGQVKIDVFESHQQFVDNGIQLLEQFANGQLPPDEAA